MRLKFLSVIAGFFLLSLTVASCLGSSDNTQDYPIDATIWGFELDTIYGVNYKFTIDQLAGNIYNIDSVPHSADTIIDRILVKSFQIQFGYVTTGDTLFIATDSIDFSKSMDEPIVFKVTSLADPTIEKEYEVEVRRHLLDPDLLVWSNKSASFSGTTNYLNQKTVILRERILSLKSDLTLHSSYLADGRNWTSKSTTGLPANTKVSSLLNHNETLYVLSEDNKVFSSIDGTTWSETGLNAVALLSSFPESNAPLAVGIAAVVNDGGVNRFAISNSDVTAWELGEVVSENFPLENISSVFQTMPTRITRSVIVGKSDNQEKTIPWFSLEGKGWAPLDNLSMSNVLPPMKTPTIIYYNGRLHAFGDDFKTLYVTNDGIVWREETNEKLQFPEEFEGRKEYSAVVDNNNFIWIVWTGVSGSYSDEVWAGRLNRLGFDIQ